MYARTLQLAELLKKKSFFLFGPRSTGKSTLIRHQLPEATVFDLLDNETYRDLLRRPRLLEERGLSKEVPIVIDEIQKLPLLLDEVHRLIEKHSVYFLLTGSSARKLRQRGSNLLAGRAWTASLFPLTSFEIPEFDLITYLNRGGLPQVITSDYPDEELRSYVGTYLREEIQAEALTRNIQAFTEFLDLIALSNGQEINYESLANDCGVSPGTIKNYIELLEDTLIGFRLPAYTKTKKRKAISRGKHYLFDIGVTNVLCQRGEIRAQSELFGATFEHFIVVEIRAYLSYRRFNIPVYYWRSTSKFEVDLIIGSSYALEIKSTSLVNDKHLRGLRAFAEEKLGHQLAVVSLDNHERKTEDGIWILPYQRFLELLWSDQLLSRG
jgi:uncharacterized protein